MYKGNPWRGDFSNINKVLKLIIAGCLLTLIICHKRSVLASTYSTLYTSSNLSGNDVAAECNPAGGSNCPCSSADVSIVSESGYGIVTSNAGANNTWVNAIGYKKYIETLPNGSDIFLGTYKYKYEVFLPTTPFTDPDQQENPQAVHLMIQLYDGRNALFQSKTTLEGAIYWDLNPWTADYGKIKIYKKPVVLQDTGITITPDFDWHTFELEVNLETQKYVSITIDGESIDLGSVNLAQVSQETWGDEVYLAVTTESMAAWPGASCNYVFTWSTRFRNLEFSVLEETTSIPGTSTLSLAMFFLLAIFFAWGYMKRLKNI